VPALAVSGLDKAFGGLRVEFTVDPANVEDINAVRRADAHAELKRWLAGDHAVNNLQRAH